MSSDSSGGVTLEKISFATTQTNLVKNGSFELIVNGALQGWSAAPQGMNVVPGEGRCDSAAIVCESNGEGWFGASQTILINQTTVRPILVRGWSRAENVTGSQDSDYSVYVDLLYDDGSPLWGQTGNFRCGTHDWEKREFIICPEKPVRSLTIHCLFRKHAGKVWFDDVVVEEILTPSGATRFQGAAVQCPAAPAPDISAVVTNMTAARHVVDWERWLRANGGGFAARDVAADSDFFSFDNDVCSELGLTIAVSSRWQDGSLVVDGRLRDLRNTDRAVTLVFTIPIDPTGLEWGDDVHRVRKVQDHGEFVNTVNVKCGATGTLSLYPMAAVWSKSHGLAVGIDMAKPAVYRIGYNADLKRFFLAYDFGLVRETQRFPSGAEFRFVVYSFDPAWGYRTAWHRFTCLFPKYFKVRATEHGLWMPFTDVSKVPNWHDFGFKFHEGNSNVSWDDVHGVLSFRYTEPMTWWMRMEPEMPRTYDAALSLLNTLATSGNQQAKAMAKVTQMAGMHDETGQFCLLFRNEPWCNGAVWSLNPNPWLGMPETVQPGQLQTDFPINAATVHWNDEVKARLYGPEAKGQLDGEYLDSLEGYVTAELNFRRDHFKYTTVPLTFDMVSKRPALFKGLAVFEFTKWIADDVHGIGKLTFANGVPYRFTFLCPWLDVMGTETDWLPEGKYRPTPDSTMILWRTMAGGKPYLILMNSRYDNFTPQLVERYFQRCLFYGMWPGFFSHNASENPYWENPKWYERDRPLFKKYIPLIRQVSEAGWQPVTYAHSSNNNVRIERFGPNTAGTVFFTCFNGTEKPQDTIIQIEKSALQLSSDSRVTEILTGEARELTPDKIEIHLEPHETKVLYVTPKPAPAK